MTQPSIIELLLPAFALSTQRYIFAQDRALYPDKYTDHGIGHAQHSSYRHQRDGDHCTHYGTRTTHRKHPLFN